MLERQANNERQYIKRKDGAKRTKITERSL